MPRTRTFQLIIESTPAALAVRCAGDIAHSLRVAARARGVATIAVSGGSTPALLFDALANEDVLWDSTHVFQVDERVAPDGDADRNAEQLRAHLLDKVDIPDGHVHLMPTGSLPPGDAARTVEHELRSVCAGVLDVVHLGMGDDGHTASLVPGDAVLGVSTQLVATTKLYKGRRRVTLTYPAINQAREIVWLVTGASKAPVVPRLFAGDPTIPAGAVFPSGAEILYLDAPANAILNAKQDSGESEADQ